MRFIGDASAMCAPLVDSLACAKCCCDEPGVKEGITMSMEMVADACTADAMTSIDVGRNRRHARSEWRH